MNATTVAVDLAKNVFEVAVADRHWKIIERARLTRAQFERWFDNRECATVVMEACGSAHHFARWLTGRGFDVKLLPAQYVRAYVKRKVSDDARREEPLTMTPQRSADAAHACGYKEGCLPRLMCQTVSTSSVSGVMR